MASFKYGDIVNIEQDGVTDPSLPHVSQWQRKSYGSTSFEDIEGETGENYTVIADDYNSNLRLKQVFAGAGGEVSLFSNTVSVTSDPPPFEGGEGIGIGLPSDVSSAGWSGGCLTPDGIIYFAPTAGNRLLEFNPETKEYRFIPVNTSGGSCTYDPIRNTIYSGLSGYGNAFKYVIGEESGVSFVAGNFSNYGYSKAATYNQYTDTVMMWKSRTTGYSSISPENPRAPGSINGVYTAAQRGGCLDNTGRGCNIAASTGPTRIYHTHDGLPDSTVITGYNPKSNSHGTTTPHMWGGVCVGFDNNFYVTNSMSYNTAGTIQRVNVPSYAAEKIVIPEGMSLSSGPKASPTNEIFWTPTSNTGSVTAYNHVTNTWRNFGNFGVITMNWGNGVLGADGNIYCPPSSVTKTNSGVILKIPTGWNSGDTMPVDPSSVQFNTM